MTVRIDVVGEKWAPEYLVVKDGKVVGRHKNWSPAEKQKAEVEVGRA